MTTMVQSVHRVHHTFRQSIQSFTLSLTTLTENLVPITIEPVYMLEINTWYISSNIWQTDANQMLNRIQFYANLCNIPRIVNR